MLGFFGLFEYCREFDDFIKNYFILTNFRFHTITKNN